MTNQEPRIYPLIKDEDLVGIPAPYTEIIKFIYYTVFAEEYAQAGNIKMSTVITKIVNNPEKLRSPIAKLMLLYEILYPGKTEYWLKRLPMQHVQNIYNEYIKREADYEKFVKASFGESTHGSGGGIHSPGTGEQSGGTSSEK